MSNKKVAGASSSKASETREQDAPATLTPKLRFPEFRDGPGWKSKPMSEVYSFKGNNSLSRDKLNYERGTVKNIHYGDIHTKFSTHFDITKELVPYINQSEPLEAFKAENFCVEGDMIFADASEDLEDIGKAIEIVRLNGERVLSGLHTILARQTDANLVASFGGHLFKSKRVRTQIQKESQGSKVLGLSGGRLAKIEVPFPSRHEQQKIADCLTSLDEVIAAQRQKLAALKTHKKGLMQQLFPREGETLPRLRFPEFNTPWKVGVIDDLASTVMGNAFRSTDFVESGTQVIRIGNLYQGELQLDRAPVYLSYAQTEEFFKFIVKPLDLLMSMTGTVGKRDYGFVIQVPADCKPLLLNQPVMKLASTNNCDAGFLLQLLKDECLLDKLYSLPGETKQANLSAQDVKGIETSYPQKSEQQKIASCLTSLDDLITAQTQKLAALKTHKKGLMQQLFPSPEELEA